MASAEAMVKTPTSVSSGFTLLEVMLVLLLLGLLVGVGLTVDFSGSPSSQRAVAAQVAEQLRLASLEAVQSGDSYGLDFVAGIATDGNFAQGYRWLRFDGKAWQPVEPALLDAKYAEYRLPDTFTWQLQVDGSELRPQLPTPLKLANGAANPRFQPTIVLQPSRSVTPFALTICEHDGQSCSATLVVDALGRVEQRDDDAAR